MAEEKKKKKGTAKKNTNSRSKKKTNTKSGSTGIATIESHKNVVMLSYLVSGILLLCFAVIRGSNIWSSIRGIFFSFFGITLYLFAAFLVTIGIKLALNNFKRSFVN